MNYTMTTPCKDCPFLKKFAKHFAMRRLEEFASGEFACHKTCDVEEDDGSSFVPNVESVHCAGALIFLEKRGRSTQMMRIVERLGRYDASKLDMNAQVR